MPSQKAEQKKVRKIEPSALAATNKLEEMQWFQLRHDEIYHADICLLRIQARIAHHTLHLGKYSGKMVSAFIAEGGVNHTALIGTVLDAIIIAMSSANTLNMALWNLDDAKEDLIGVLAGTQIPGDSQVHVMGFTVIMGRLAKAVEALDHVEKLNSRAAYEDGLKSLWRLLLSFWRVLTDQKLDEALRKRMYAIESRNMFYGRHPSYENGFQPVSPEDID